MNDELIKLDNATTFIEARTILQREVQKLETQREVWMKEHQRHVDEAAQLFEWVTKTGETIRQLYSAIEKVKDGTSSMMNQKDGT